MLWSVGRREQPKNRVSVTREHRGTGCTHLTRSSPCSRPLRRIRRRVRGTPYRRCLVRYARCAKPSARDRTRRARCSSRPLTPGLKKTMQLERTVRLARSLISIACVLASACSSGSSSGNTGTGDVTAGKAAVTKYACQSCHGQALSGSATAVTGTKAYAPNLTADTETGLGDWDAATIKTAVLTGRDDEDRQLCATMPQFGKMGMTDNEATNIVAYLKSLSAVSMSVPESECASGAAGSGT
jgi:mono/diheme cytochrome c family protein